jgi:hypothetical protein
MRKDIIVNVHYGYGTEDLEDGASACFENFASIMITTTKDLPSDRAVKKALHTQGFATQPVRSLAWICVA